MKINDKVMCESKATYGSNGEKAGNWTTISEMSVCGERQPIPVKKGDQIIVQTSFDFEEHPA